MNPPLKKSRNSLFLIAIFSLLFIGNREIAYGDLTFEGPSGYIFAPSAKTIHYKQIEWSAHTRQFHPPGSKEVRYLTNLTMGFSPIRDLEIGVQKAVDSRRGMNDYDPDPTINFKVKLPPFGSGDFSEPGLGMVLDTNPNNYHSLYFCLGGVGVVWNFGGNPGSGIAHFGKYDHGRKQPRPLCLTFGGDLTPGPPGERGYRSHCFLDYNGDFFSACWRLKSNRGFWIDAGWHGKSDYDFQYRFVPVFVGVGAIF